MERRVDARVAMTQWEVVDRECFRHRSEPDNIHEPSIHSFIQLISLIHYLYMQGCGVARILRNSDSGVFEVTITTRDSGTKKNN